MVDRDAFQRYIDAGVAFTNITRSKAEELVQELVRSGEFQSDDARAKVEELIERSRKGREALVIQVRREVSRQLEGMGITNVEDLAKQVSSLLTRTAEAGRAASAGMKKTPAKKASGKKAAAKKSPAKKASGKKAAAKKSPPPKQQPRSPPPPRQQPRSHRQRRRPRSPRLPVPPAPGQRTDPLTAQASRSGPGRAGSGARVARKPST